MVNKVHLLWVQVLTSHKMTI